MDKNSAREAIKGMAERFASRLQDYNSTEYLESQLRTDFLDELFKALGWDVANKANLSRLLRQVLVEKGDTKGRPDYSFRIDGEDRFFVEAKAPSKGTIKPEDIFQAKRYGWNTRQVNITVLTDFKTFKVFDTTIKPDVRQPRIGLLFELAFDKFAYEDFEKLWLFSHEQVAVGSLDGLSSVEPTAKRSRIPVDTAFLQQMTDWRERFARDIFKCNPEIGVRTLNDVVQKLLDRFVFIRILEDRRIIKSESLREIADNWSQGKHRDISVQLSLLFKELNRDFNGEIFKEQLWETVSADAESIVHESKRIRYDSKVVADIIDELYYPKSPYDFAVIGVELLGSIYERYLGKTIRLTEKRVKVEEKPEVRKAGGVYYTPRWVVKYIVENTVGKLIENKTPEEVAKLHVLDPACGSGSFLIGALERLLEYHLDYYLNNSKEARLGTLFPNLIVEHDADGNEIQRLSIEKKSEILRNNIYGVDVDPQAVEITMMSLYIKILEGERTLPHKKELLPPLSGNIRCGNSLIGYDVLTQGKLFEEPEKDKVNPFEWRSKTEGFGNVIGEGEGFHAIVGNPPYIRIQTMKEWAPREVEYFDHKYKNLVSGDYDIYLLFLAKAIELLDSKGLLGLILPHKFFQAKYGKNLRKLISEKKLLREIVNFRDQQVFDQATTYTCLFFLSKQEKTSFKYSEIKKLERPSAQLSIIQKNSSYKNNTLEVGSVPLDGISEMPWQLGFGEEATLLKHLRSAGPALKDVASFVFVGLQTSADPIYIVKRVNPAGEGKIVDVYSKALDRNVKIETGILKPLLKGEEIKRYSTPYWQYYLIFPYRIVDSKASLIPKEEMEVEYPLTWQYLNDNKKQLLKRDRGELKVEWYAFGRTQNIEQFQEQKIMTQVLAKRPSFTLDRDGRYYFVGGGNAGGYGIKLKRVYDLDPSYVIGLLNSRLLEFYLKRVSTPFRGGFFSFAKRFIEQLPMHIPNRKDSTENQKYMDIISLVDKILELKKRKEESASDASLKTRIERETNVYEEKIDSLVYDLYRLTQEEKDIVEGE